MSHEVVGYRRPPASAQFKKGASGNPKGRPKGSRNFLTLLEQELAQTIVVTEHGKKAKISRLQAIVKRMVAGSLQGDQKALLTLIGILLKSGGVAPTDVQDLLPDNYQEILDGYVASRSPAADVDVPAASRGRKA